MNQQLNLLQDASWAKKVWDGKHFGPAGSIALSLKIVQELETELSSRLAQQTCRTMTDQSGVDEPEISIEEVQQHLFDVSMNYMCALYSAINSPQMLFRFWKREELHYLLFRALIPTLGNLSRSLSSPLFISPTSYESLSAYCLAGSHFSRKWEKYALAAKDLEDKAYLFAKKVIEIATSADNEKKTPENKSANLLARMRIVNMPFVSKAERRKQREVIVLNLDTAQERHNLWNVGDRMTFIRLARGVGVRKQMFSHLTRKDSLEQWGKSLIFYVRSFFVKYP